MSQNTKSKDWLSSIVVPGKKIGRILNFPTLNLRDTKLMAGKKEGVYVCRVKIKNKEYYGLLYYGPRLILQETKNILEIYVFNFNNNIYWETIQFQIHHYLRAVKNFPDTKSFQKQLEHDKITAQKILSGKLQ